MSLTVGNPQVNKFEKVSSLVPIPGWGLGGARRGSLHSGILGGVPLW